MGRRPKDERVGKMVDHPWYRTWIYHKRSPYCPWRNFFCFLKWAEELGYTPEAGDRIRIVPNKEYGFWPHITRKGEKPRSRRPLDAKLRFRPSGVKLGENVGNKKNMEIRDPGLHELWTRIMDRCYNSKSDGYARVGAQGIRVCDAWQDYMEFVKWVRSTGRRRFRDVLRLDLSMDYEPENCMLI